MAIPKPDIGATRLEQAQEASAPSAIPTPTAMHRRLGWPKLREHVTSHHEYLEEDVSDASDEDLMEHDDEADLGDDLCHKGCEVCYSRCPFSLFRL